MAGVYSALGRGLLKSTRCILERGGSCHGDGDFETVWLAGLPGVYSS
jgi:hypothetical protein